jgi:hypothetical protein
VNKGRLHGLMDAGGIVKILKIPPVSRGAKPRHGVMNDVIRFGGRGKPNGVAQAKAYEAGKGYVYCLVTTVCGVEFVTYYCRMVVIDPWGIRLVNPFRRISVLKNGLDLADYLPKDLYVFCAARLEEIPVQEWMVRECI